MGRSAQSEGTLSDVLCSQNSAKASLEIKKRDKLVLLKKVVTRSMGGRGEVWETGHRSDKAERKGERVVGSGSLCSTFL